jgi:hypothetical protein
MRTIGPVGAIGIFLMVFGAWLLVVAGLSKGAEERIVNAAAALVIGSIGLGAYLLEKKAGRRPAPSGQSSDPDSEETRASSGPSGGFRLTDAQK